MSSQDRIEYAEYLDKQYADWMEHTGGVGYIWYFPALTRAGKPVPAPLDAWRGPWRNVRPYVTTEFRQWIEEHSIARVTFSEWHAERIQARRAEVEHESDYVESAEYCLDRLEQWAELNRERDEQICESRSRGASFKQLVFATGLTRMAVHNVLERARLASIQHVIAEAETITAESASEWITIDGELVEAF